MNDNELFYMLALQKVEGVGDITAKKLLSHFDDVEEIFRAKPEKLASINNISSFFIKNLNDKTVFEKASKELEFIKKNNINCYSYRDDGYPERLKQCVDGPLILFSVGNINLKGRKIISIVGTRQITPYGADFCKKFIEDISPLNPIIVSGFAYGVDIQAHLSAMEHGLQTIAIFAHGLNKIYPPGHTKYAKEVIVNGGFMTEFWSSSNPDRENFIRRNRIVAGMAEAVVVVESGEKGGSLITANIANDYNRDVFAVPGRITDKQSVGCNNLIKTQKANLLSCAADLVYILNWDIEKESKPIQKQLFVTLEADEQKIYDFLINNGKEMLDIIALKCETPIYRLTGILLNMEIKGVIRALPGKMYEGI